MLIGMNAENEHRPKTLVDNSHYSSYSSFDQDVFFSPIVFFVFVDFSDPLSLSGEGPAEVTKLAEQLFIIE